MASHPTQKYTLEEYLALERQSEIRYEYWAGEVFALSGGSLNHDLLAGNVYNSLFNQLAGRNCRVFTINLQIKVPAAAPYRYADGSVVCGQPETEEFNGNDLLVNPSLIWEVLSPSTEAYDRGDKFTYYKSIPSFTEYLLIAQHRLHVTHFLKQTEKEWLQQEYNDQSETITLASVNCKLPLSEIYRDVALG